MLMTDPNAKKEATPHSTGVFLATQQPEIYKPVVKEEPAPKKKKSSKSK